MTDVVGKNLLFQSLIINIRTFDTIHSGPIDFYILCFKLSAGVLKNCVAAFETGWG